MRLLIGRQGDPDAVSSQASNNSQHRRVRLDPGPDAQRLLDAGRALPVREYLGKSLPEIAGSAKARPLGREHIRQEVAGAPRILAEGLQRLTPRGWWLLNDAVGVEEYCGGSRHNGDHVVGAGPEQGGQALVSSLATPRQV